MKNPIRRDERKIMARIVIIGAGPAGSSAGYHLARAGHGVTIIERNEFPRPKVCGEFISPSATRLLEQIIPEADLLSAGARRISTMTVVCRSSRVEWPMPQPAWALSRAALDSLLLHRAAAAGATVVQPASVRLVQYEDDRVRVSLCDGAAQEADIVIHADGSGRHDPAGPIPHCRGLIGFKCHTHNTVPGEIRMLAAAGAYLGTIRVESGLATCALVASKKLLVAHAGDIDSMVRSLDPAFDRASRDGAWLACPVPRSRYIKPGHPRSFRIGNAAAAVDPVGGEGIGLALWAGTSLAGALNALPLAESSGLHEAHRTFASAYRARLRFRLVACRVTASLLSRPGFMKYIPSHSAFVGTFTRAWYSMTGKGDESPMPEGSFAR